MEKERRQQKLLDVINSRSVGTQAELAAQLERAGFAVTQSSISRDLEELGIVKKSGRYVEPLADRNGEGARGLFDLIPAGDALVVARCEPGLASAVAVQVDRAMISEIVGTLAGEDTVFVAVSDKNAQRAAIKKIWKLFA